MELGAAIRAERGRLRLTQSDLAMVAGTSRQAIAALEQERGRVSTLVAVEATLRLHVKGLTHGDTLIERVRLTRERRKLSLREVAARAGVSVNTVREIEAGRGAVSSLIRLVKAFAPHAHFRGGASRSQKTGFVTVGRRISQTHNPSDYFPTPAPITRLLLDSEEFSTDHEILEPAVGKARAIEKVLHERGYATVCFDLHGLGEEKRDFFTLTERYHSLITNPPFSLHLGFIQHAKRIVDDKIALLLPINYLTGEQRRFEIWEDRAFPLARVHVLSRGINFSADPHVEKFASAQLYMGWFVFERRHIGDPQIKWIDCSPWIERKRQPKRSLNSIAT